MIKPSAVSIVFALVLFLQIANPSRTCGADLPGMKIPDVMGVQFKASNADADNLDRIQKLGLKFVRRGFKWEEVEKKPGLYDFSAYDKLVGECNARSICILGCIALNNEKLYGHVKDEPARQAYAKYAAALAAHFKDANVLWELWNEPNTMSFWGKHGKVGNREQYVRLVKAAVPAMKAADPDCFVMAGAVSGLWTESWKWQQFCFDRGVLKSGIDAWSVHPYSTKCPEDYPAAHTQLREMMVKAGATADFPIINSERGYPIGKAEGYAGGDPVKSAEYQAWHIVRQYVADQLCGVKLTIWYEWRGNEGFELVSQAGDLAPAYNAAKTFVDGKSP